MQERCKTQEAISYCGQYGTCQLTGSGNIKCVCEQYRRGATCQEFDYEAFFKNAYSKVFGGDIEQIEGTRSCEELRSVKTNAFGEFELHFLSF